MLARVTPVMVLVSAILLVMALAGGSSALSLKPTTFRELRQTADGVVLATVASVTCECADEPYSHGVQTRVRLNPSASLSGALPIQPIDLLLPGGSVGGLHVAVPGVPAFKPGESAALFLRKLENNEFALAGYGLGVYRLDPDNRLTPDVAVDDHAAGGETLESFRTRLALVEPLRAALPAPASIKTEPSSSDGHSALLKISLALLGAVVLLLLVLLKRRRHTAAMIILVGLSIAGAALTTPLVTRADTAASRDFTLSGNKWDLASFTRGRVMGGRVLWVRGTGTEDIPDDVSFNIITQQFQKWEDIPTCAIAFRQDGITIEAGTGLDERNVVSFLKKVPRKSFDPLTLAITFQVFESSLFIDADIVFNDQDVQWVPTGDRFSLDVVALHEIGHFLGLDHTTNVQDVMYPVAQGTTVFSPGDAQGASMIYPVTPPQLPVAIVFASPAVGAAPLDVSFSSATSASQIGESLTVLWDFGDGSPQSTETAPVHPYTAPGTYAATLTVTDSAGSSSTTATIIVGNGGPGLSVSKFSFKSSLIQSLKSNKGKDGFSITLTGASLQPGDEFSFILGGIRLQTATGGFVLDSKLSFKSFIDSGGMVTARSNPKTGEFTVALTGALLGTILDPRGPNDISQAGAASFPVILSIKRGTQTTVQTTTADFSYVIKSGSAPGGFLEKSITGKK